MKNTLLKIIPILVLITSCNSTSIPLSQDEQEYQKFAAEKRSKTISNPKEWNENFVKIYKESGLQDFLFLRENKSLSDFDEFFNRVILNEYLNSEYHEALKLKSITYAVHAFNLTQKENYESVQYLVKYTRELAKNTRNIDAELLYNCVSSIKGEIDKSEYNEIVKKSVFLIRYAIEVFEDSLAESKKIESKSSIEEYNGLIEKYKQYQSDFETLIK